MIRLTDIHCHLDFPEFDKDREEVIKRTLDSGMWCINVGADMESSKKSVDLAEKHDGIWATVGVHPHYVDKFDLDKLRELAKYPKVVAIGECGLDFSRNREARNPKSEIRNKQIKIFKQQIELAIELNKPLMIHCRDAHDEVLFILKSYFLNRNSYNGNVHFFSGDREQAEKYLSLGFSLSFTGVITFANQYDEVIKNIPLEKIMIETDAPFVVPAPFRGQRCESLFVKHVAQRIAEIRGISYEEVAEQTTRNAIVFFGLK